MNVKIELEKDGVYRVNFWYTVYGTATHIEASSPEEAEKWLYDELHQNGLDEFEYRMNDRDYGVTDSEKI